MSYNSPIFLLQILAFISLSTIGFGDMVPMIEPPDQYASFVWVKISAQISAIFVSSITIGSSLNIHTF